MLRGTGELGTTTGAKDSARRPAMSVRVRVGVKSAPTTNWASWIGQKGIGDDFREMIHTPGKGGLIA